MTDLRIEFRPVDSLIPYARNARTHTDEQIDQVAASIVEFGFTNPILADERGIVAGHCRRAAAKRLYDAGHTIPLPGGDELPPGTVPVIDCTGWGEAQRRAYILADNKHALNADWDLDMLRLELQDLDSGEIDIGLTGFSDEELADILAFDPEPQGDGLTDPDDVPELQQDAVSRPGDIWVLGDHRIACGSCTDAHTVAALLGDEKPHLMVTDPPYGVEYDANWRNEADRSNGKAYGASAVGRVSNDDTADWRDAWALFPGDVAYVWHASKFSKEVQNSLEHCQFEVRTHIVWAKSSLVIGRGHYHSQHEPCLYAVRSGGTGHWNGDRKQATVWRFVDDLLEPGEEVYVRKADAETIYAISGHESTVWEIPKPNKSETGHSTQKPVECMRRPMLNNSKPGDAVYEPFSGSGTTLIAGEMMNRRVFAIELNPPYVDMAVRRWMRFTGKDAVLLSTGETFQSVENQR